MTSSDAVEHAARFYRDRGYQVTVRPPAEHLPPFAADLGMDLYATNGDEHVLIRAVVTAADLRGDEAAMRAAQALQDRTDGWRLDLVVLNPDNPSPRRVVLDLTNGSVTKRVLDTPIAVSADARG